MNITKKIDTSSMSPESKPGPVTQCILDIQESVSRAENILSKIEDKLEPLLCAELPSNTAGLDRPPQNSRVGESLNSIYSRAEMMVARLSSLSDRIQL